MAQCVFDPLYVELCPEKNWSFPHPLHFSGTHRSADPVSMSTVRLCRGEPKLSGP